MAIGMAAAGVVAGAVAVFILCSSGAATDENKTVALDAVTLETVANPLFYQKQAPTREYHRLSKKRPVSLPRVLLSFGTRPEAIKMAPVIQECKKLGDYMETWVMSTGQHREMVAGVMDSFGLSNVIDFDLNVMTFNQSLNGLSVKVLEEATRVIAKVRPAAVVVQGDTTTAAFVAWAAFYAKIPVVHVEAGLRTRDMRSPFPEEANRNSIGNIASLHFPATPWARSNLLGESKHPYQIVMTGNPVVDALYQTLKSPLSSVVQSIRGWLAAESCARMVLLTAHRRENHGPRLAAIVTAVGRLLRLHADLCVVYPLHPNPNVRQSVRASVPEATFGRLKDKRTMSALKNGTPLHPIAASNRHFSRLALIGPVDHSSLSQLMREAYFILTDSGGVQEEGVSVGKPVLILRDETERPEVVLAGGGVLCGESRPGGGLPLALGKKLEHEANMLLAPGPNSHYDQMSGNAKSKHIYGDGFAADYIAHEIVNRLTHGFTNKSIVPVVAYEAAHPGGQPCLVGPYYSDFDRISLLLLNGSSPGMAYVRYADGELGVLQQIPIGKSEWAFRGTMDRKVSEDLLATLRGHLDQPYYYGFSSPFDDTDGLKWYLSRLEQRCGYVSYSNLWANRNYGRTKRLLRRLLSVYNGKLVVVANEESVSLLHKPTWAADTLALEDDVVSRWGSLRTRYKHAAEALAKRYSGAMFLVSGGPIANILIDWMWKVNTRNKYVDFGSALDPFLRGKNTRSYQTRGTPTSIQVDPTYHIYPPPSADVTAAKFEAEKDEVCDVIAVFTVWKRDTLDHMLTMMHRQTILKTHRVCATVFQNAIHQDIRPIIANWKHVASKTSGFSIHLVTSTVETGYYGRFAVALTAHGATTATYWALFDDDVIYGSRYLENAIRVNNDGYFCTRNGRMVDEDGTEQSLAGKGGFANVQATNNHDADWDFGGHIWVGKMQWLRWIWRHPPALYITAEDFWLSAVLKSQYAIGTRTARCPHKSSSNADIELCACSMKTAIKHVSGVVGTKRVESNINQFTMTRTSAIKAVYRAYGFKGSLHTPQTRAATKESYVYTEKGGADAFDTKGTIFSECLYWV